MKQASLHSQPFQFLYNASEALFGSITLYTLCYNIVCFFFGSLFWYINRCQCYNAVSYLRVIELLRRTGWYGRLDKNFIVVPFPKCQKMVQCEKMFTISNLFWDVVLCNRRSEVCRNFFVSSLVLLFGNEQLNVFSRTVVQISILFCYCQVNFPFASG